MVALFRFVGHILGRLPIWLLMFLGDVLGLSMWLLIGSRRRIAFHNLGVAFPELSEPERASMTKAHFRHLGRNIVEMLTLPALRDRARCSRRLRLVGFDKLDPILESGQGVVLMTAHMGNWEVSAALGTLGYPFSVMYKEHHNASDQVLVDLRESCGCRAFPKKGGLKGMLRSLKKGEILAFVADQGGNDQYPFFGRPARFPLGPPALAVRHHAPAFPVFPHRDETGTTVITVLDQIGPVQAPDRKQAEHELVRRYIEALERHVRLRPEQYYWVHDVWRDFKKV